ncbi:MAG: hypothetical protein HZA46_09175 [Planctomycetales bacterium]|nr:hypothetical protein [Planctomycetales bacterium]
MAKKSVANSSNPFCLTKSISRNGNPAASSLVVFFNNFENFYPIPEIRLEAGRWTEIVTTFSLIQKRCEVFINGKLVTTIDLPKDFDLRVMISASRQSEKHFIFATHCPVTAFHGLVDQLVVHNRVLTSNEILGIFGS